MQALMHSVSKLSLAAMTFALLCPLQAQAECTISTANSVMDYGELKSQLQRGATGLWLLPARDVNMRVDCDDAQQIRLSFSSLSQNQQGFAFGHDGFLKVAISSLMIDSQPTSFRDLSAEHSGGSHLRQASSLVPGSQIVTTEQGRHLSFTLTLRPSFSERLFALQDSNLLSNDIIINVAG